MEEATQRHQQGKHESPFQRLKRPHNIDDLMFVPRSYKKQAIAAALSGPSSSSHATPVAAPPLPGIIPPPPSSNPQVQLPNYHHQLFTYDQVASIVKNALDMREEQIREEYNRTLQELLREQVRTERKKVVLASRAANPFESVDSHFFFLFFFRLFLFCSV